MASAFDLDTGRGQVNLFRVSSSSVLPEYVCTWADPDGDVGRILSVAVSFLGENELVVLTTGKETR